MILCTHDLFEFYDLREDGMHCQGWVCKRCGHLATGECHHESWCRVDFCGAEPVTAEEREPAMSGS